MATRFSHGSLEMRRSVDKLVSPGCDRPYDTHRDDVMFSGVIERVSPAAAASQNSVRNCSKRPTESSAHPLGNTITRRAISLNHLREGGEVVLAAATNRSVVLVPAQAST